MEFWKRRKMQGRMPGGREEANDLGPRQLATAAAPTETTTQNHHAHAANRGEQRLQGRDDDRLEAIRTSEDPRERMIREGPVAPMEDHAAPLAQTTLEEEEEAL